MARSETGGAENPEKDSHRKQFPERRSRGDSLRANLKFGGDDLSRDAESARAPQKIFAKDTDGHDLSLLEEGEFDEGEGNERESRRRCTEWTVTSVLQESNAISNFPGGILSLFEPPGAEERLTVSPEQFLSQGENELAIAEERDARKSFGTAMLARARELGLAEEISIADAMLRISPEKAITLEADIQSQFGMYHLNGWDSARLRDTNEIMILVPANNPNGSRRVGLLNLNGLYQQDPEFVEEKIADYQVKEQRARIANRVESNKSLHESDVISMIPSFMNEVGKLDDPEDYAIDAQSLMTFALYLRTLGPSYLHRVAEFVHTIQDARFQLPDGRMVSLDTYLSHANICPGNSEEDRQQNERMKTLYDGLSDVLTMRIPTEIVDYDTTEQSILHTPAAYAYYPEKDTQRLRGEKGKQVQTGNFFAEAKDAENRAILHIMLEELTEAAQAVGQLREKLGKDFLNRDTLDEIMSELGKDVYYGSINSLDQLHQRLGKDLAQQLFGRGEALGIGFDAPGDLTSGYIHNKDLAMVLPALVLHETKEKIALENSVSVDFGSHQYGIENAEQAYERLQDELITRSGKEVARIDRELVENADRKNEFRDFVEEYGILSDEIRLLGNLAESQSALMPDHPSLDHEFYTVAFHALWLSKQGKVDFRSPIFKSFLQSLYPTHAEKIAENL